MGKKWIGTVFVTLFVVGLAVAQSITVTEASSPGPGKVNVKGTFDFGTGFTFKRVYVQVRPSDGKKGEGSTIVASSDVPGKSFSGTPENLPAGKYDAVVILELETTVGSKKKEFFSNIKTSIERSFRVTASRAK